MLSWLSNRAIFYKEYFHLKNHPKNTYFYFHLHEERELLFIVFSSLLFMPSLFKNFSLLVEHKDLIFLKRHLNDKHIHKTYLSLLKFIEELHFEELSTQAKHLRVRILHVDIILSFCIFSLLKYDWIFGKNLEDDTWW